MNFGLMKRCPSMRQLCNAERRETRLAEQPKRLRAYQPPMLSQWFDAGSACIGSQQEAKPETHFRTWNISAVANLQIIAAVKAIFAATENERTVTAMAEYIERGEAIDAAKHEWMSLPPKGE